MRIANLLKEIDHALWVLEEHDKLHFGVNHNTVAAVEAARAKLQIVTEVSTQLVIALEAARGHLEGGSPWALGEQVEQALTAAGFYEAEPKEKKS